MNDERDMAPMIWGYKKSRETARRMDCYAGEVTALHPHFRYDSPVRAEDLSLEDTKAYAAGKEHLTAGLYHGSWSRMSSKGQDPNPNHLNSNQVSVRGEFSFFFSPAMLGRDSDLRQVI
jgi:alcohol oxidase